MQADAPCVALEPKVARRYPLYLDHYLFSAFLLGTHHRLGACSPVRRLELGSLQLIRDFLCHKSPIARLLLQHNPFEDSDQFWAHAQGMQGASYFIHALNFAEIPRIRMEIAAVSGLTKAHVVALHMYTSKGLRISKDCHRLNARMRHWENKDDVYQEKRIDVNWMTYTMQEYIDFYGDAWEASWNAAQPLPMPRTWSIADDLFARVLLTSLAFLGDQEHEKYIIFRGMVGQPISLGIGDTFWLWGITSCSLSPQIARSFTDSIVQSTFLEIHTRRSVDIERFSSCPGEVERILPPGSRLTITGRNNLSNTLLYIKCTDAV